MTSHQLTNIYSTIRNRLCEAHYQELKGSGLSDEAIFAAGHFTAFTPQIGLKLVGTKHSGLIFQYLDPTTGQPYKTSNNKAFFRIKPDDWDKPPQDEEYASEPPKYLSPKGEGCRPYFSSILSNWKEIIRRAKIPIWITEGEKKADLTCSLNIACIGLGGVSSWQDKRGVVADSDDNSDDDAETKFNPLPELDEINWKDRRVVIAFDSDMTHKHSVRAEFFKLALWLKNKGAHPETLLLPNNIDGSKNGLDDFAVRYGVKALEYLEDFTFPALKWNKTRLELNLPTDPNLPLKAALLESILRTKWAFRKGIGWYEWTGKVWRFSPNDTGNECPDLEADIIDFMNAQGWVQQASIAMLCRRLRAKLLVEKDLWNRPDRIAFKNGTMNLTTGRFEDTHSKEDYLTNSLPYDYDAKADCPDWLDFLEAIFKDQSATDLIQAIFKWILLPKPKDENAEIQKSLLLIGRPGTGKGTFLDVLTWLVGAENTAATADFREKAREKRESQNPYPAMDREIGSNLSEKVFLRSVELSAKEEQLVTMPEDDIEAASIGLNSCSDRAGASVVLDFLKSLMCSDLTKEQIWSLVPPLQQRRLKGKLPWECDISPTSPIAFVHEGQTIQIPVEYPGTRSSTQTKEPKQIKDCLLALVNDGEYKALVGKYGENRVRWVLWRLIGGADRDAVMDVIEGRVRQMTIADVASSIAAESTEDSDIDDDDGGSQEVEEEKCDRGSVISPETPTPDGEQTSSRPIFRVGDRVEVICPEGWPDNRDVPTGSTGKFFAYKNKRNPHEVVAVELDKDKAPPSGNRLVYISPVRLKLIDDDIDDDDSGSAAPQSTPTPSDDDGGSQEVEEEKYDRADEISAPGDEGSDAVAVEQKCDRASASPGSGDGVLTGRKLAKHLRCSPSLLSNRPENFLVWSRKKDPDGIGWEFNEQMKLFFPETVFSRPIVVGDKLRIRKSGECYTVESTSNQWILCRDQKGELKKKLRGEFELLCDFYSRLEPGCILKVLPHNDHKTFIRKHKDGILIDKREKDGKFQASVLCGNDREIFNLEAVQL
ncbi:DUF3854 domain-containing protein [Argonema antarcticum]|uniref:DUF3854 domain-containing protein n=1 Tax=Argonema antarcticum TaxID=2942763 RepID=UPI00201316BB|nr:DUF3854 domain-containing protein [Argonema antarcticum]MCL1474411.1 DUF3854 domain-containing protein [Argonema antarcticum A004/B2]